MISAPHLRRTAIAGLALCGALALIPSPARADGALDACDALAAARFDQERPANVTPVDLPQIDGAKARPACEAAVAAVPAERRAIYELGRVQLAAKDYAAAFDSFKKASDLGSAMATADLATMYDLGIGRAKDPVTARGLAQKAADAGNPLAAFNLAVMVQSGRGGPKDPAKARGLLEKATAAGVPRAFARLGYAQELGIGGPIDLQKAKATYTTCANDPTPGVGQPLCQRRLGFLYDTGALGRGDPTAAKLLFEKAAAGGDIEALRALGQVYEMGKGVHPDYAKARDYYEKAAAKGDAGAMRLLGLLYERGLGVPRDAAKAKSWADKAKTAADTEQALKEAGEAN